MKKVKKQVPKDLLTWMGNGMLQSKVYQFWVNVTDFHKVLQKVAKPPN